MDKLKKENARLLDSLKKEMGVRGERESDLQKLKVKYEREKEHLLENMKMSGDDIKLMKTKLTHSERDLKDKEESLQRFAQFSRFFLGGFM